MSRRIRDHPEDALRDILGDPDGWVKVPYWEDEPTLYWRTVKPFRVHVVYYLDGEVVRVIAYAHEAREPGYWRHRIGD